MSAVSRVRIASKRSAIAGLVVAAGAAAAVALPGTAHAANGWTIPNVPGATAAGMAHSLVISDLAGDGLNEVYASGDNTYGQLGNNSTTGSTTFVKVHSLSGVRSLAAGDDYSVAVKQDGTVWAWGRNNNGQLGNGTTTDSKVPVRVPGITNAVAASASETDTVVVVLADGTVKAWGSRTGNCAVSSTPVTVSGLTGVSPSPRAVASAYGHVLVAMANGTVKAWGANHYGQLGTGNTTDSCSPVTVPGLTGVTEVSAKGFHSLARLSNGTVKAWGSNNAGQLGDGTTTNRLSPSTVSGLSQVAHVSAGYFYSTATTDTDTGGSMQVWTWGQNNYGQLGLGHTTWVRTPSHAGEYDLEQTVVEAGPYHALYAVPSTFEPHAWGRNDSGQLGLGDTTHRSWPTGIPSPEPAK